MTDAELLGRLDALEAKVDKLAALLEAALAAGALNPAASPDEAEAARWKRLGLDDGERRTVTVLFADVSGFTALSEKLDPEAFQLVMRETMAALSECATREDGTVEKFIGDALCAVYGAPTSHPDEPQRAARAALAMHRVLAERAAANPDLPVLGVHVGINTGPVIAGAVGDGTQFGTMGDTINSASRLMNLATEGETFVGAETARRLRREFALEDRGLHEVKGKSKPMAVYALQRELTAVEQEEAATLRAPLIGRDEELRTLRNLSTQAAAGDGCTVILVGEDGVGTSRVVEQLAAELQPEGWRVLHGAARVHADTPLGLVSTALAPLLAEDAGAIAGGTSGPLAATLESAANVAPHDFELMLGEVVTESAKSHPLLVILDDADDADPGSVEVIRYLSRVTADDAVLWVLTGNRVPPAFDQLLGSADVVVMRLDPLTEEHVADLFEALLPGALTPAQRGRLAHLAEGNAQFAKEIALSLVDDGVVVMAGEGWQLTGDLDDIELPGSVSELIEARIDQLATTTRLVLQDASVIGLRFGRELLQRVASTPAAVEAALADLVEAELVLPPGDGNPLWTFRSRLVRDVAYGSILRRRLPAAHRAVADALLDLEPDRVGENADLLAHHFEEGDDPPLAVPHLLEAIDRAENAYNFTGALERARRGLRLRDRFPGRVGDVESSLLHQRVGIMKLVTGDRTGVVELEEAVRLRVRAGGERELADLEERLAWYLTMAGERVAAVAHLQAAQGLAEKLGGAVGEGVLAGVGVTRAFTVGAVGDLEGGLSAVEGAAAAAEAAGNRFVTARALLVGGVLHLWAGRPDEAIVQLRECLDRSWAEIYGTLADRCGRWLVRALVDAGRHEEALELADPILARADDRGDPAVACGVRAALAASYREQGDLSKALGLAEEAVAITEARDVAPDAAAEANLVLAATWLDTAGEGAIDRAERAVEALFAATVDEPWLQWRWRSRAALIAARIALVRGAPDAALAFTHTARTAIGRTPAAVELAAIVDLEAQARATVPSS